MKKEQLDLKLIIATVLLVCSIPIMLILPYLLKGLKLPIRTLDYIGGFIMPVAVAAFVLGLINAIRVGWRAQKMRMTREEFKKIEFGKIGFGFALAIFLMFAVGMFGDLMESSARIQIKEFLASLSGKESVFIDGQLVKDPQKVVDALKNIRWMPGHRSHDTNRIDIRIVDGTKF